jgi:hypothetical protein
MSKIDDLYIDGDIFVTDNGSIVRFVDGRAEGWEATPPQDTLLREAPHYSLITGGPEKRVGRLFGYDRANARVIAMDKAKGDYAAQYRLAGDAAGWRDIRGMYVVLAGEDDPPTLIWASKDGVFSSILEAVPETTGESPSPSGSAAPSGSGVPASGGTSAAP